MRAHALLAAVALLAGACGGGGGGPSGTTQTLPGNFTDPVLYSGLSTGSLATANEIVAVTQGTVTIGGSAVAYTATVGHRTALRLGTGEPQASFFYVAYTVPGRDPATRPVTYFYNGGPGSASMWLHLGSYGPKRLAANAPSLETPQPFPLVDNAESLLDVTDLVFVDAVGTGLSQAIAPRTNASFWGVTADAEGFRDFVMRHAIATGRQASPRFLFGESYGTTRSAVLARLLEQAGSPLAGVVLLSSVMDYNANCGVVNRLISCAGYVPSYAATAAWFSRVTPPVAAGGLDAFLADQRAFTQSAYQPAVLAQFASPASPPPAGLATQLSNRTGYPESGWTAQLNLRPASFRQGFAPGTLLGRYDARMAVPTTSPLAAGGDPSNAFPSPSFTGTIPGYLGSLGYTNPTPYLAFNNIIDGWDFSHDGRDLPDVMPDLAAALALNPRLKVLAVSGYHDLATPFHQTELDLARLANPAITVLNYVGGHMMYLDDASRVKQKSELAAWYRAAVPGLAKAEPSVPGPAAAAAPALLASPPAALDGERREVVVPDRLMAKATPLASPRGEALARRGESLLASAFEAAAARHGGSLSRSEAEREGLGYVARDFDAIAAGRDRVDFADVRAWLSRRTSRID